MFVRIILVLLSFTLLSSCANFSLKRSANNKLIDTSGFEGGKRRPVYNKKYITRAKHNVMEQNYDDDYIEDEDSESINSTSMNRSMYRDMIEQDNRRKAMRANDPKIQKYRQQSLEHTDDYQDLSASRNAIDNTQNGKQSQDMQKELSDIKKMLAETKKDMAKYRCPMQQDQTKNSHGSATSLSNSIGVGGH